LAQTNVSDNNSICHKNWHTYSSTHVLPILIHNLQKRVCNPHVIRFWRKKCQYHRFWICGLHTLFCKLWMRIGKTCVDEYVCQFLWQILLLSKANLCVCYSAPLSSPRDEDLTCYTFINIISGCILASALIICTWAQPWATQGCRITYTKIGLVNWAKIKHTGQSCVLLLFISVYLFLWWSCDKILA
jgi:hypothetical protein